MTLLDRPLAILHDNAQVREVLREGERYRTDASADVNDGSTFRQLIPLEPYTTLSQNYAR